VLGLFGGKVSGCMLKVAMCVAVCSRLQKVLLDLLGVSVCCWVI